MSPAGTSVCSPMCRYSSVMNDWQNRMTSPSDRPFGSKSAPPLPPPMGRPVSAFLNVCSNPRNFMMLRFTLGWNRRPPLYGPSAELNSTRKPRLICTVPLSSTHGTRKMICRSGSHSRWMTLAYSGCLPTTRPRLSSTSCVAWWNSLSFGLRRTTSRYTSSSLSSNVVVNDDSSRPMLPRTPCPTRHTGHGVGGVLVCIRPVAIRLGKRLHGRGHDHKRKSPGYRRACGCDRLLIAVAAVGRPPITRGQPPDQDSSTRCNRTDGTPCRRVRDEACVQEHSHFLPADGR